MTCQYESLKKSQRQIALRHDTTQESQTCNLTEQELLPCFMNYRRIDTVGNSVAKTLMGGIQKVLELALMFKME